MTCKKKYNTGNPLCSSDPRDLSDNAQIIDSYVNSQELTQNDRFDMPRKTWAGIEKDAQDGLVVINDNAQDVIGSIIPTVQDRIDQMIVESGGVEIAQEWGDREDATLSQKFLNAWTYKKRTPQNFGAIADGIFHPLSEFYSSLTEAQNEFPNAASLDEGVDSLAIELAVNDAVNSDIKDVFFYGHYIQDKELIIYDNVKYIGSGFASCIIQKKDGFLGRSAVSSRFDELTGTSSNNYNRGFSITGIRFHGLWMRKDWRSQDNEYVNESGGGVFLYAQEYHIDFSSEYQAGVGIWLEANHLNTQFDDHHYFNAPNIRSYVCKEECLIYKGGVDAVLGNIHTAFGGAYIYGDTTTPRPRVSPNYPDLNRTDNIVFDKGCEFEFIHSWASESGYAIRFKDGRFNGNMVMGESTNAGAFYFDPPTFGMISRMDAHACYGSRDGSTPDIHILSNRGEGLSIGEIRDDRNGSGNMHGQTALRIEGSFVRIGSVIHNFRGQGGNFIELGGFFNNIKSSFAHNSKGLNYKGEDSTALVMLAGSGNFNSVNVSCVNFPVIIENLGDMINTTVNVDFRNTVEQDFKSVLKGSPPNHTRSNSWSVTGNVGGTYYKNKGVAVAEFPADTNIRQEVFVPLDLPYYLNIGLYTITPRLGAGSDNIQGVIELLGISRVSGTGVYVVLKMAGDLSLNAGKTISVNIKYGI